MSTFGQEEDKAIEAMFDGEELVKQIGGLAGKSISKDIKHANPRWVTDKKSKWGKAKYVTEDEAKKASDAEEEAKKKEEEKKAELAQEKEWVAQL